MITQAIETVEYVWEYERTYGDRYGAGRPWVDRHGGYNSEAEALEAVRIFLREWPTKVDLGSRDYPPQRFRITRVETHTRYLPVLETADLVAEATS